MIDPAIEPPISLKAAAKLPALCRDGKPLHVCTLYRWAMRGVSGEKLETTKIGGCLVTTEQAVYRLLHRLSNPGTPADHRTPATRLREADKADKSLAKSGW